MSLENIVVGTDFSSASERAIDTALGLVAPGGRVTVLHVCQVPPYALPDLGLYVPSPELMADIINDVEQRLATLRAGYARRGIVLETQAVVGEPPEELVRWAEDHACDLIVVGTHGRRGFRRFMLGSVAEKVVRMATRPVLTVHAGDEVLAATAAPAR